MAKETSQKVVTWKTYRKMKDNIKISLRKISCVGGKQILYNQGWC